MATPVKLPALGESVTEGTVTRWLKEVGDTVEADEPLLEVSTDKVDTEIPSPAAGTLLEIKVGEDETVEVGTELGVIGDAGESSSAGAGDGQAQGGASDGEQTAEDEQGGSEPGGSEPETPEEPQPKAEQPAPSGDGSSDSSGGGGGGGTEVTLPALGESVTEGTVTRWLKAVGDTVEADEPLVEISTDKVDTEIPSPAAGTVTEIKVGEDETVAVGTVIAVIGGADGGGEQQQEAPDTAAREDSPPQRSTEPAQDTDLAGEAAQHAAAEAQSAEKSEPQQPAGSTQPDAPQRQQPAAAAAPKASSAATRPTEGEDAATYVTPLVRRLAAEHGVDLSSVQGTGVGGRIRKQDVLAAAEQAKAAPPAAAEPSAPAAASAAGGAPAVAPTAQVRGTTEKMSRLRKVIATRMVESLQVSAQLTTVVEVDVSAIARVRGRAKAAFEAREGVKLSFLPFFAKAALEALKAHPKVNATIDTEKGEITYPDAEHLGIAVDTERGLLVPVIKDAGDLNIAGLSRKIADLAERTRTNKITPDELSGGTFTLTNTGSRGALFDTPIINQPQVAILGTGAVVKRPVVVTDENGADSIAIRQMVFLALTYDHRLVDGADAARFLTTVKGRLENGSFEAELGV